MKLWANELKPGMVLDEGVSDAGGKLLLPAGAVLDENHLRILNIWGVTEAEVRPDSVRPAAPRNPAQAALASAHADALFAHADLSVPPMVELKRACANFYADRLAAGERLPPPPEPVAGPVEPPPAPLFADAREFLSADVDLGAFPAIYHRIVEALHDPVSSSGSLADIIAEDPGLSARLLALVNSALYGYSQPVDSLSRAVALVGTKGLTQLALAVTVMHKFGTDRDGRPALARFRRHCVATAAICRILAVQVRGVSQDLCFVAGLLRDVGRLVMLRMAPEASETARRMSLANAIPLDAAERRIFGFDQSQAVRTLFTSWRFPDEIIAATERRDPALDDGPVEGAVCAVGGLLATAMQYGDGGNGLVHAPPAGAWGSLGLPESALAVTLARSRRQVDDLLTVFRERT
ncbi:HDOD domain-containing protein [Pseudodesulfovibrio sp.]|uniref:HDOD domain-containing protein n=1 Tax=Pseudodesulfovibrio sp. TaxID=2035812 RepID=UPI002606AE52|nr:HDOD domain-containing protein [Pseudodesulfovibrio sp.]MDD3311059.1 HDOD domain-containing protein [Pseudodesulfovibrio sp.]